MKSFFYSGDPESLISSLLRAKVPLQQHHGELNTTTPPQLLPLYKVLYDQQIHCTVLKYCHF